MTIEQWLMIVVFIAIFASLVKYSKVPERVFSVTVLTCLALSFVSVDDILSNAVNPGLVTLILLCPNKLHFCTNAQQYFARFNVILSAIKFAVITNEGISFLS